MMPLSLGKFIKNLLNWSLFYSILNNWKLGFLRFKKFEQCANTNTIPSFKPYKSLQLFQNLYLTKIIFQWSQQKRNSFVCFNEL